MTKAFVFATAVALLFTAWLAAERSELPLKMNLVTNFNFDRYPACTAAQSGNCIRAIRFYDADSSKLLVEAPVNDTMRGWQRVAATTTVSSIPRRAYAVTVYLDSRGHSQEGPRGAVSEFTDARW